MLNRGTRRWARRVLPAPVRHLLSEMVFGPRVDEVELVHRYMRHVRSMQDTHQTPSGRVMIDVGAHTGEALEQFARDGWKVIAFEPDPDNRSELTAFCSKLTDVAIDSRAMSNREAKAVPWYRSKQSSGISSLEAFHKSHEPAGEVEISTLAIALEQHGVDHVDFLKVDAEGTDLFVLQGFPWDKMKPDVVVCEFEDDKTEGLGYCFHDLADFLLAKGYQILVSEWFPITQYGERHRWRRFVPYPCELVNLHAWGNLIAVRSGDELAQLRDLAEG